MYIVLEGIVQIKNKWLLSFEIRCLPMFQTKCWPFNPEPNLSWSKKWEHVYHCMGFLMAQMVKNPCAMQETQVWFLSWEDLLEKGMATQPSILAWRIPWTEEPGGYSPWGLTWLSNFHSYSLTIVYNLLISHFLSNCLKMTGLHIWWDGQEKKKNRSVKVDSTSSLCWLKTQLKTRVLDTLKLPLEKATTLAIF